MKCRGIIGCLALHYQTKEIMKSVYGGLKGKNIDVQTAILLAQINKALKGSVMSAEFLRDTAGQRPEDTVKLNTDSEDMNLNININYGNSEEQRRFLNGYRRRSFRHTHRKREVNRYNTME